MRTEEGRERHREEKVTKIAAPQCTGEEGSPADRRRSDCASCGRGERLRGLFRRGEPPRSGDQKARVEAWPAIISVQAFNQQDSTQCTWGKTKQPSSTKQPITASPTSFHSALKMAAQRNCARKLATCVAIATNKTTEMRLDRSGNVTFAMLPGGVDIV